MFFFFLNLICFPLSASDIAYPNYCSSHQLKLFIPSKWTVLSIFITLSTNINSQYSFCLIHLSYIFNIWFVLTLTICITLFWRVFLHQSPSGTLSDDILQCQCIVISHCFSVIKVLATTFFNLNLAFSRPVFLSFFSYLILTRGYDLIDF